MNKQQFLAAISYRLSGLPPTDISRSLDYYSEMIDDRIEDGLSEEDAVAAMGNIDDIVAQILMETPLPKLVKAKARPSRSLRWWEIALIVAGAPLWAPLLLTAVILCLVFYLLIWVFIAVFYFVDLILAFCGAVGLFGMAIIFFSQGLAEAALCFGISLISVGISILLFFGCNFLLRGALWLSRLGIRKIKSIFIRKGLSNEAN